MNTTSDYSTPTEVKCFMAPAAGEPLRAGTIVRRGITADDVVIDIKYAGICHSDIHETRNEWADEWGKGIFPMVPGHEIVGEVVAVGSDVIEFQVGERVGVGCMVDSCRSCRSCTAGEEQYCATGMVKTYGSQVQYKHCAEFGNVTYGGYSQRIVVDKHYVLHVPESIPFETVAPLLCAGITMYSPLKYYGLQPHHSYAVAGIGGLGHMAVKFGVAMGNHTTVISRGNAKRVSALNELKAHAYIDASNLEEMRAHNGKFDFIISSISAPHDIGLYLSLLTTNGKLIMVGVPPGKLPIGLHGFILGRRTLAGSLIGGIRETQEMLNFCAQHNITADVEVIAAQDINEAFERAMKGDVKYRFVIDTSTL